MGVAEDAEAQGHEEDCLFEGGKGEVAVPSWRSGYLFCFAGSLLGLIVAWASGFNPTDVASRSGLGSSHRAETTCGPEGVCPMWSLFVDMQVHAAVAETLVQAASPALSDADLPMVRGLVASSFRNITKAIDENAPQVANELRLLKINATVKQYITEAMALAADTRVQNFGRYVAAAVRASPLNFEDEEDLKRNIVEHLWHQLDDLRQFQLKEVSWQTHSLWMLGGKLGQWEMTLDVEAMGWMQATNTANGLAARPTALAATNVGGSIMAVEAGALAEGRTLLDLMLMCIRSEGAAWDVDLHGAVDAFSGPLSDPCEPELLVGESLDFSRALICPLKFGMLGMDALRYASTMERKPEQAACQRPGLCPLRRLFFDASVHKMVAKSLVGLGVPLLGTTDVAQVTGLVRESFRSISSALQKHSPSLGDELNQLSVNSTVRGLLLQAMKLTHDPQVQSIGRYVARVMAEGRPYKGAEGVRQHLAKGLEDQLGNVKKLQDEIIPWALRQVWGWGKDQQWELALAIERAEVLGSVRSNPRQSSRATSEHDMAIAGGALEEGRALLDIMLMCIRSKGPSWGTALGDVEELFQRPLSVDCGAGKQDEDPPSFRSAVVCPLKFGLLGLDALRYVQHLSASGKLENLPCMGSGACHLGDIFFDNSVQERAVADIIGAAADPSLILGRSELPIVRHKVIRAFRNISAYVHKFFPLIAAELGAIPMDQSVRRYIFEALQLMTDTRVQDIGRHVSRALRANAVFDTPEDLKTEVMRSLWRSFPDIQRLQSNVQNYNVRTAWRASDAPHLELTFELEVQEASKRAPEAKTPLLRQEEAVEQAAWQEGRAVLDLALAYVHSGLGGAVGTMPPPPHVHCNPDMKVGQEAGFMSSMVCPLRFGIIGMDVLRFTDSIFTWSHSDLRSCKDRGMCPMGRLFFDHFVYAAATADILRVAADAVDPRLVEQAVRLVFRNVSVHVHLYATGVAENLLALQTSEAEKEHFIEAMQLVSDPRVQAFGREVAMALRASIGFTSPEGLKEEIVGILGARRIEAMRTFALRTLDEQVLRIWEMGKEEQWCMTTDAETIEWMKASVSTDPAVGVASAVAPALETPAQQAEALRASATVEGRVLVDLMMMRIRAMHSRLSNSLSSAMNVFTPALAVPCSLEPPDQAATLREVLLCPLKFGALGLDAVRFATSLGSAPSAEASLPVGR